MLKLFKFDFKKLCWFIIETFHRISRVVWGKFGVGDFTQRVWIESILYYLTLSQLLQNCCSSFDCSNFGFFLVFSWSIFGVLDKLDVSYVTQSFRVLYSCQYIISFSYELLASRTFKLCLKVLEQLVSECPVVSLKKREQSNIMADTGAHKTCPD